MTDRDALRAKLLQIRGVFALAEGRDLTYAELSVLEALLDEAEALRIPPAIVAKATDLRLLAHATLSADAVVAGTARFLIAEWKLGAHASSTLWLLLEQCFLCGRASALSDAAALNERKGSTSAGE